jgi:arsenate reductase
MTAHWGVADPVAFVGSEERTLRHLRTIHGYLESRIKIFVSLPLASLDRMALQQRLDQIGRTVPEGEPA